MRNVSDIIAKCNDIKVTEFLLIFKTASEEMEGDTRDGSRFSNIRIFYLIIEYRLGCAIIF